METVLAIISILLLCTVFLSLVKHDYWIFKVLEYPRLQKLVLVALLLISWGIVRPTQPFHLIVTASLGLAAIYLLYKIIPYTTIYGKEVKRSAETDPSSGVRIFSANVYQDNTRYEKMLEQIRDCDPDLIFLLETNGAWLKALDTLKTDYPYTLVLPLENTYGLAFYSRFEIEKGKINFLVKEDIPSIEATVLLPSGERFKLWGLHPEPPLPGENLYSTAKDKELMKVAIIVERCEVPAIVFGDLNDVAWSHTTSLFRKTSHLLDPRRGRGFYSTFSAHSWFLRYPLDYIFCSTEFQLVRMFRLPKNGSDHFATFTHLVMKKEEAGQQAAPKASASEEKEAVEKAKGPVKG